VTSTKPTQWHPSATAGWKRQDRDLPGPHWAEVWDNWPDAPRQVPPPAFDPAAWSWAIRKLAPASTIAAGTAPDADAAKQAVDDWLIKHGPLEQTLWNVVVPVLALLRADNGKQASDRLARALKAAGFEVYDPGPGSEEAGVVPLECEDQSLESDPPPAGWPW
jgi:hypothetical protein